MFCLCMSELQVQDLLVSIWRDSDPIDHNCYENTAFPLLEATPPPPPKENTPPAPKTKQHTRL